MTKSVDYSVECSSSDYSSDEDVDDHILDKKVSYLDIFLQNSDDEDSTSNVKSNKPESYGKDVDLSDGLHHLQFGETEYKGHEGKQKKNPVCTEFEQENEKINHFLKQHDEYRKSNYRDISESIADKNAFMSVNASSPYAIRQTFLYAIEKNDTELIDRILRDMGIAYLLQHCLIYDGLFQIENLPVSVESKNDRSAANIYWLAALNGSAEVLDMLAEETLWYFVHEGCSGSDESDEIVERCKHDLSLLLSQDAVCYGLSPLFVASLFDHASVIRVLLKYGIDPNETNQYGDTAALLASRKDCVNVIRALAQDDRTDFNITNRDDISPFLAACHFGSTHTVHYLAETVQDIKFSKQDKNGYGCLASAAANGRLEVVTYLCRNLNTSIDINQRNLYDKSTALHVACRNDFPEIVSELLQMQSPACDTSARDIQGMTALHVAADCGHHLVVKEFVHKLPSHLISDFDTEDAIGLTPLFHAILNNHENVVKILACVSNLSRMCRVPNPIKRDRTATDATFDDGSPIQSNRKSRMFLQTPLVAAVIRGNLNIIYTLLHCGADVNQCDRIGYTPLMHAAIDGHYEAVEVLVSHFADVKIRSNGGRNAIQMAKRHKHNRIVSFLESLS